MTTTVTATESRPQASTRAFLTGPFSGFKKLVLQRVEDVSHNSKKLHFAFDDPEMQSGLYAGCKSNSRQSQSSRLHCRMLIICLPFLPKHSRHLRLVLEPRLLPPYHQTLHPDQRSRGESHHAAGQVLPERQHVPQALLLAARR